jgi:hypothetical protein
MGAENGYLSSDIPGYGAVKLSPRANFPRGFHSKH